MTEFKKNASLIDGPWFEDFYVGQEFRAPSITLTEGYTAIHQALFADRLRLPLDYALSEKVFGRKGFANPSLICNFAIGQTTQASQRVKGNLFYRGLNYLRPVFVGDTLTTNTQTVALKQNAIKPGRAATGMVALEMVVTNQNGEEVMHFWRCPMIPCRDRNADTGKNDSFDFIPDTLDIELLKKTVSSWQTQHFLPLEKGALPVSGGQKFSIVSQDTVTNAPELVRMTLNMAKTHTDASASAYNKRLVYGGHTISMAASQLTRALPDLVSLIAWKHCDHTAPVFEQDLLRTDFTIDTVTPLANGQLLDLHVEVFATRGSEAPEPGADIKVLDWTPVGFITG